MTTSCGDGASGVGGSAACAVEWERAVCRSVLPTPSLTRPASEAGPWSPPPRARAANASIASGESSVSVSSDVTTCGAAGAAVGG